MSSARSPALLVALLMISACSSSPFQDAPPEPRINLVSAATELHDPPRNEVVLLADYYGLEISAPPETGSSPTAAEIRELLEAEGYKVFAFSGNLGATATGVAGNLEKGRPLLALIQPDSGPIWIFLVGLDEESDTVIVQRPDGRLAALSTTDFDRFWSRQERITILAMPLSLVM